MTGPTAIDHDGHRLFTDLRAQGFTALLAYRFVRNSANAPKACSGPRGYASWDRRDGAASW